MDALKDALTGLISVVLCGLVTLLGVYIKKYLTQLTTKAKSETEGIVNTNAKKLVDKSIDRINSLVYKNVEAMENTLVKEIKSKENYNVEELKAIAEKVKTDVLTQTSTDVKGLAQVEIEDLEEYIKVEIEVALKNIKETSK